MSAHVIPAAAGSPRPLWGDERLALRVADGDERAFAALYERYHQRLFRYCVSILRNEPDAADALQSTFERALCALRAQQRNAPLRPWLYRIAHNEAITLMRRRPTTAPLDESTPASVASAEHVAVQRDRLATLVGDLAALPERARSALVMRELEGLSHEEIAIALDTTVGAAKQTIFEARGALAAMAEGREMTCDEIRRLVSDGDRRVLRGRRVRAHLSSCAGCAQFASAISERTAALRALAPPLAPLAAAAILARASGVSGVSGASGVSGVSGGAAGGTGAGGLSAAGAGKGAFAAVAGSKAALGAAVLVTATAGVAAIEPVITHHTTRARPARMQLHRPGVASAPAVTPIGARAAGSQPFRGPTVSGARAAEQEHRGPGAPSGAGGARGAVAAHRGAASASRGASGTAPHGRGLGHASATAGTATGATGAGNRGRSLGHSGSAQRGAKVRAHGSPAPNSHRLAGSRGRATTAPAGAAGTAGAGTAGAAGVATGPAKKFSK